MSDTDRFYEIWKTLSHAQRKFVMAMTKFTRKRDAALSLGIQPSTVYNWPPEVDEALSLLVSDILGASWDGLREAAARATQVKTEGLDAEDENLRQRVATEILDRVHGRPRPRSHNIESDDKLEIVVTYEDEE